MELDKRKLAVLEFLRTKGHLENIIKNCCLAKAENLLHPIELKFNVMDLGDFNIDLANFLLEEPIEFQQLLRQVIYAEIIEQKWMNFQNVGQLMIDLIVDGLPPFPELSVDNITDLSKRRRQCYVKLDGVIVALSTPVNYTHGANYVCQNNSCQNSVENKLIRIHVPGVQECQTVRDDFSCNLCGGHLEENVKSRMICEKVKAEMIPIGGAEQKSIFAHSFRRNQSIVVYFRGALARLVHLGHRYTVTALSVSCYDRFTYNIQRYLEATHVDEYRPPASMKIPYCLSDPVVHKIKKMVQSIKSRGDHTAFLTPLVLAYYFAEAIVPNGLYLKTKLGVLCALATCGNSTLSKGEMSILVIGEDHTIINRLLSYATGLAPISTTLHNSQQLKVGIRPKLDCWTSGFCVIEGNPLVLATNGVCYLGELNKFNINKRMAIANCLVNESIAMDGAKQTAIPSNVESLLPHSLPLNCQLWTYSAPSTYSNGKRNINQEQHLGQHRYGDFHKCLLDAFSMVYYPDVGSNNANADDQMPSYTLCTAMESNGQSYPKLTHEEYKTYLNYAQNVEVTFEESAKELVQAYFVAIRRIRTESRSQFSSGPSINAIGALLLLAEAYAKLNLRSTVTQNDAVSAILLYEECMSARYGVSRLNVTPTPHWYTIDFSRDLAKAVVEYEEFQRRLKQFIHTYGSSESGRLEE